MHTAHQFGITNFNIVKVYECESVKVEKRVHEICGTEMKENK